MITNSYNVNATIYYMYPKIMRKNVSGKFKGKENKEDFKIIKKHWANRMQRGTNFPWSLKGVFQLFLKLPYCLLLS